VTVDIALLDFRYEAGPEVGWQAKLMSTLADAPTYNPIS